MRRVIEFDMNKMGPTYINMPEDSKVFGVGIRIYTSVILALCDAKKDPSMEKRLFVPLVAGVCHTNSPGTHMVFVGESCSAEDKDTPVYVFEEAYNG